MAGKDHYYNKAKQEGYRSRAAYKLKQLDDLEHIFDRGDTVVDLVPLRVAGSRLPPRRSAHRGT